jgi:hypothetical protein
MRGPVNLEIPIAAALVVRDLAAHPFRRFPALQPWSNEARRHARSTCSVGLAVELTKNAISTAQRTSDDPGDA